MVASSPGTGPGRRLYHQVAAEIAGLIAGGAFPPGANLPAERELAARLGISRSSVREAVIALEVMGLVEVRVGSGVLVLPKAAALREGASFEASLAALPRVEADPELPVALDLDTEIPPFSLLQARRLVEPQTAALAAINASEPERAAIEAALARNRADNRAGSVTHPGDRLFHIRIAQASGNPAYELFITLLLGHRYGFIFQRLQRLYAPVDMTGRSEAEHEAVLAAIMARDPDAASAAMARHLDSVIAIFSRDITPTDESDPDS
jgi:GntR family transcriptional repressor for pyruvate dehydrogenase complex